jgi:cholesterol oxidase
MTARLSHPIESLINDVPPETVFATVDVAIVGSGYGGSIAAACLAGRGRRVVILERGREYALGDFPVDLGQVPGHVRFHRADADEAIGYPDALFDFRVGKTMDVLVGSGLGGTSLINANVAAQPTHDDFRDPAWPHQIRTDPRVLDPWFGAAMELLGVRPKNAPETPKHRALSVLGAGLPAGPEPASPSAGCEPASLAVTFARPDQRNTVTGQPPCTRCGNCVTGCNVGAKNTLMMNALPRAKARGAELFTGASVLSVMPSGDERHPWIIRLRRTASEKTPLHDEVFHLKARDVILAAGTLGSTEILKRSGDRDGLRFSGELGKNFSGNGDVIAFGFAQKQPVHAIGEPDQHGGPY